MIYVSFQALYCLLLEGKPSSTRTPKIICTALPALITAIYLAYPNPVFHQVCYGALQLYIAYRLRDLLQRLPVGSTSKFQRDCERLLTTGSFMSVLAFGIWNMDNILCENITMWRETVGPIGILSQGHAWWHILVAIGSNRAVTAIIGMPFPLFLSILHLSILTNICILIGLSNGMTEPDSYEIAYRLGVFPYLKQRTDVKGASKQE
jgi:dihydroceramidase